MATTTTTAKSSTSGDRSASPPPMDSGTTKNFQGQQNEADPLLLTQEAPSINSQSSISEQKSYSSKNSGANILDISGMVSNAITSTSDTSVLAQGAVDILTAEPAEEGAAKQLAEEKLATKKVQVMQDGKLYPQSPSKLGPFVTPTMLETTVETMLETTVTPIKKTLEEIIAERQQARVDRKKERDALDKERATLSAAQDKRDEAEDIFQQTVLERLLKLEKVDTKEVLTEQFSQLEKTLTTKLSDQHAQSLSAINNNNSNAHQNAPPAEVLVTNNQQEPPSSQISKASSHDQPSVNEGSIQSKDPTGSHVDEVPHNKQPPIQSPPPVNRHGVPLGPNGHPTVRRHEGQYSGIGNNNATQGYTRKNNNNVGFETNDNGNGYGNNNGQWRQWFLKQQWQ